MHRHASAHTGSARIKSKLTITQYEQYEISKWSKPSLAWRNKTIRDLVKTLGLAELTIIGELTPFTTPNQVKNTRRCITVSVYLHKCKYREFTPKCKPLVTLKNRKARLDFQRTTERVLRRKIETDPETSSCSKSLAEQLQGGIPAFGDVCGLFNLQTLQTFTLDLLKIEDSVWTYWAVKT